jgi:ATPase family associated with various cellular activities (AAA)
MYAESHRPVILDDVIGHQDIKQSLEKYLKTQSFFGAVFMIGPPGIGKTTMALCAARTFGFDALEINASKSIRSFEDVDKLKDSCRSCVNIQSFIRGDMTRKTCVILDEVDGSDPHAQAKIVEWVKDPLRTVPILCTGNELPTIFKRNTELIQILRCYPPKASEVQHLFPGSDAPTILKECQHDIRRVFHKLQYGDSYIIPEYPLPPTGTSVEVAFLWRQKMFELSDPLECHADKLGTVHSHQTKSECKIGGKRVGKPSTSRIPKQLTLDK